ncbi:hypothetical protein [Bifidobacterium gallicum]|nr:hypothetical protein [Bifidobacterium gallicum]
MDNYFHQALRKTAHYLRSHSTYRLDTYKSLTAVQYTQDKNDKPRLNLIIPNIEKSRMYGGQKTAYRFFTSLLKFFDGDARILTEQSYDARELNRIRLQYPEWNITSVNKHSEASRQIIPLDPGTRLHNKLPLRPHDFFVFTYWTGAYASTGYHAFQEKTFGKAMPHIHLIQDFEPGFNAWNDKYLLTDTLYHMPDTIAVFNSHELKEWFEELRYNFFRSYVFSPKLDPDIARHLNDENINQNREKLLIFYGRPGVPRNCFPLVINALNKLLTDHPEVSKEWRILSIGSDIPRIKLADGQTLQSPGKMTLDDYATLMHRASIGVSLMCSPHPSYPPLEMAAFGIRTITNSFGPKNLGDIPNIISLDSVSIEKLADTIWQAMQQYGSKPSTAAWPDRYSRYLNPQADFFDDIMEPLAQCLNQAM